MISRKERKIQKALGTEDSMPPTICKQIWWHISGWWWCHITAKTYKWRGGAFWQWLAFKLPKELVYHCAIRVWAHATTCPSGCSEEAGETTMNDAIQRWKKNSV